MRGVGLVISRFLEVDINTGLLKGMIIVLFYAVLEGIKGITCTQVAQYCVYFRFYGAGNFYFDSNDSKSNSAIEFWRC